MNSQLLPSTTPPRRLERSARALVSKKVSKKTSKRAACYAAAAAFGIGALVAHAPDARADEVSPKGKGIVGGALLGGEVVVIVEALAGCRAGWAYALGGGLGAVGGGIGGYFVEQGSTDGRVPVYMLAGGLALVIPAVILVLNGTRYMPDENATEDKSMTNLPPAEPGRPGGGAVLRDSSGGSVTTPAPAPGTTPATPPTTTPPNTSAPPGGGGPPSVPLSLLDVNHRGMRFGVPVPNVKPMWSQGQLKEYGLKQGAELRMPLVNVVF